jgi:hypothetical protein
MHPLDPNTIDFHPGQRRIYGGCYADVEALVDEEDYFFFSRWMWLPRERNRKIYLARASGVYGVNGGRQYVVSIYLHVEILTRAEGPPPTRDRIICDHINGNSLDCRRQNLRWLTKRQNNQNRFGRGAHQRNLL